jgi:competence protein ComGF
MQKKAKVYVLINHSLISMMREKEKKVILHPNKKLLMYKNIKPLKKANQVNNRITYRQIINCT